MSSAAIKVMVSKLTSGHVVNSLKESSSGCADHAPTLTTRTNFAITASRFTSKGITLWPMVKSGYSASSVKSGIILTAKPFMVIMISMTCSRKMLRNQLLRALKTLQPVLSSTSAPLVEARSQTNVHHQNQSQMTAVPRRMMFFIPFAKKNPQWQPSNLNPIKKWVSPSSWSNQQQQVHWLTILNSFVSNNSTNFWVRVWCKNHFHLPRRSLWGRVKEQNLQQQQ